MFISLKSMRPIILLLSLVCLLNISLICKETPYLNKALKAAEWIRENTIKTPDGHAWPSLHGEEDSIETSLYSGIPGIILFFIETYYSTGQKIYLDQAQKGADYLLSVLPQEEVTGLYVGLSGIGFSLQETYKATGAKKYHQGFMDVLGIIEEKALRRGKGIEWSTTTDIISGNAGTGLFLVYAFKELKESHWLKLAALAGHRLIENSISTDTGLKWAMDPDYPRFMPNFSHGTAGIAFFLTVLHRETGDKTFLDAAESAAEFLVSIANTDGKSCLIFHHEPGGENLFYLGWCHGPVGTSRLFYNLFKITGNKRWMDMVDQGARGILKSGIPEKTAPGFWNNFGLCCGSAGVAEFFLSLHMRTNRKKYLKFSKKLTKDMIENAQEDNRKIYWIHAEHRTQPDFLTAQTGLMQGAAGIGLWLLHLDAFINGKHPYIVLPDDPFTWE